jgi:hypothetical protein
VNPKSAKTYKKACQKTIWRKTKKFWRKSTDILAEKHRQIGEHNKHNRHTLTN